MSKENENDLLSFDWEDSNEVFFGLESDEEKPIVKEDEELESKETPKRGRPKKEDKEEEEEIEDDFFSEVDAENEKIKTKLNKKDTEDLDEDNPLEKPKGSTAEQSIYVDLYRDLKEQGIFKHVELEEDEDLDSDTFLEIQEQEYEAEVHDRLYNWSQELDEDAKAFIKFKTEGGKTEDFFNILQSSSSIPIGELEDEKYQDKVIRFQLAKEGWKSDEIEDRLEYLTDTGKKRDAARRYDTRLKEDLEVEKEKALKSAEQQKLNTREQEEKFKTNIRTTLETSNDINGFKISKNDKEKIFKALTKKEHKVGEGKFITGFQKKFAEALEDTNKLILLTKILEEDFNMSDLEKQISTKKTKQIKSNIERRRALRPGSSGSSLQGSHVADFFN